MSSKHYRKGMQRSAYDPSMIRDFLEQLCWEHRINKFENENPGKLNPELVDQLLTFQHRGPFALTAVNQITRDGLDEREYAMACQAWHDFRIAQCDQVLQALDTLEPAVDFALTAIQENRLFINRIPGRSLLSLGSLGEDGLLAS